MKKQLIIIMLAMAAAWLWAAGAMAELSPQETDDSELIKQAIQLRESKPELFKGAKGILIFEVVKDGQGEKKGLRRGDIVISYAGQQINTVEQLISATQANASEKEVGLQFIRAGATQTVVLQGGQIGIHIKDMDTNIAEINRLQEEGEKAFYAANSHEALAKWEKGLELAKKADNKKYVSQFLSNIGVVFQYLGQYEKALIYYNQSLAIHKEIGNRRGEGNDLGNIGVVFQCLGQYEKALSYHEQSLVIHKEIGNRKGEGNTFNNIGLIHINMGRYDEALNYHEQALAIHKEIGDKRGEGDTLNNIGSVYINVGQYNKALSYYEKALVIKKKIGYRRSYGTNLGNIGSVFLYVGHYEKALSYYEQALAINRESGDRRGEGGDLGNIGVVYEYLGQHEKALSYYEQALAVNREIGDRSGEGTDLGYIGDVYWNIGHYEKALSYYERALAILREVGDRKRESTSIGNIGGVYWNIGHYEKALSYCEQSLNINKEINNIRGKGNDLTSIGVMYDNLEQHDKAEFFFAQSIKIFSDIGAPDALWQAQRGLAQAQSKSEKYDDAVKNYEQSLDNIEKVREGISEKESRTTFMQNKIGVYDEFITLLKKLHEKDPAKGYDKKSFEIFERKQGRVFLEQMGESGSRNFEGFPDEMRDKETELANRLDKIRSRLADARSKSFEQQDKELIRELDAEIENISKEQSELQESIRKDYPDYYALKYPKPVKLEDFQNTVLQPGEVLLVYNVMKEKTCLWIVGKDRFGFFPLGIGEKALEKKVNKFRKEPESVLRAIKYVSKYQLASEVETSLKEISKIEKELYDLLIPEKARPLISGAKLLYVVPTASLYGLPFEALGSGERYLLEDHAVAYLSSASLLKILRDAQSRRKEKPANPLLAFAHPKYGAKENKCFSLTKGGDTADISLDQMRVRSYLDLMGEKLCELPETEKEVRGIGKLLNAPEAAFQLQEKASESNVFAFSKEKELDDYRYVVFSCHGLLPNAEKTSLVNQPALALSVPDPADKNRDGFLTMSETFGLKFNADLVVLSACDTGRGDHIRGEGVRGLTRAFMYAGTPAVSVTLWPVADKSSSILSSGFFENRENKKMSLGESLRQIKLDMIQGKHGKIYRHPYFWSPMVVFGIGSEK